jgi:hypothetical protein
MQLAHLSVMPGVCGPDCNTPHTTQEFGAGAPRQAASARMSAGAIRLKLTSDGFTHRARRSAAAFGVALGEIGKQLIVAPGANPCTFVGRNIEGVPSRG